MFLDVEKKKLWLAFQKGEKEALEKVYLEYAPKIFQFLQRGFSFRSQEKTLFLHPIRNHFEIEAFVQETFLRCFSDKARKSYQPEKPFLPYCLTICKNIVIDDFRKKQRWKQVEPQFSFSEEHSMEESSVLEEQSFLKLMEQSLLECNEREQQVFRLLFVEGKSQSQVAEDLGLGRTQVRTSIQKLREVLFSHFKETGYLQSIFKENKRLSLKEVLLFFVSLFQRKA